MNRKSVVRFLALVAVYMVVAVPFRTMTIIPGLTDVRPVMALGPVYAVFFGPLGCLASAVGNLLSDVATGYLRITCVDGFLANFVGPLLVWLYFTRVSRTPFALRTVRDLLKYAAVVLVAALVGMYLIAKPVSLVYPEVDDEAFAKAVFTNMALFPILIGIPLAILLQEEFGFTPCDRRAAKDQSR